MSDSLQLQYADERGEAIRALLHDPMINNANNSDSFRLILRHQSWLHDWFESTLGWRLQVDVAAGFARLFKRTQRPDISRVLHRSRGQKRAFDRRRYQLLCLVCANLVKHPVTTIGVLALALSNEASLDTTVKRERSALVDALRMLMEWQVIKLKNGEIDAYLDSEENNAMVYADTHRLHHLLSSATAPSKLATHQDALTAIEALLDEPRYSAVLKSADEMTEAERLRYARHSAARRVLDDPVVYFAEEPAMVAAYLEQSSGKRWLRDRAADAGFELEERREGLLAIDQSAAATDKRFPSPIGTIGQVALLLIDSLIPTDKKTGERRLASLTIDDQQQFIKALLRQQPRWAKSWREGNEPLRLVSEAINLLDEFDLVTVDDTGRVSAKPALARYRLHHGEDAPTITSASRASKVAAVSAGKRSSKSRSASSSTASSSATEDADDRPTQVTLL